VERGFGRIVHTTAFSVKAPVPTLELSNGARAGLTGAVSALARRVAVDNVTINNLLPGPFATDRLYNTSLAIAEMTGKTVEEVQAARAAENPTGRFGQPEEFGAACAFLCSGYGGYITGQNLVMDGGAINVTM
jgi:3-oxoacyl-[acyl-carrier protein] reductase